MTFIVRSEVGKLRQLIVHRPGLELSRLTPHNIAELLFDDVMWAKKAKEEHDAFVEALRDKGVTVHYFGQLLGETLSLREGREFVLDRICTAENLGPNLVAPVRKLLDDLDAQALAQYLPSTGTTRCSPARTSPGTTATMMSRICLPPSKAEMSTSLATVP